MTTKHYKGCTIDRNMNGKWIVTYRNGSHSQHNTLAGAKESISFRYDAEDQG